MVDGKIETILDIRIYPYPQMRGRRVQRGTGARTEWLMGSGTDEGDGGGGKDADSVNGALLVSGAASSAPQLSGQALAKKTRCLLPTPSPESQRTDRTSRRPCSHRTPKLTG